MKTIYVLLAVVIFAGCSKKETIVNGTVYDFYTDEPAKNIVVTLETYSKRGFLNLGITNEISRTQTDENGNFHFNTDDVKKKEGCSAVVHGFSTCQGGTAVGSQSIDIENRKTNEISVKVIQKTQILVKLKNSSPYNNNDYLHFWYCYSTPIPDNSFTGATVDTEFYLDAAANHPDSFDYEVVKNGISQHYSQNFIASNDTLTVLEINY